ncbi:MAG: YtxH domain-containing protein [Phycisphaerales bacterium]|nr:YtxH domain-containing protein [Phycisphaerales bacterium]
MSNNNTADSNSSFSHAFLPGLILGLIVGAVAGAFLPDYLSGTKMPENRQVTSDGTHSNHGRDERGGETQQDIDPMIDDANEAAGDAGETAGDMIDDAANDLEDGAADLTPPSDLPTDG